MVFISATLGHSFLILLCVLSGAFSRIDCLPTGGFISFAFYNWNLPIACFIFSRSCLLYSLKRHLRWRIPDSGGNRNKRGFVGRRGRRLSIASVLPRGGVTPLPRLRTCGREALYCCIVRRLHVQCAA